MKVISFIMNFRGRAQSSPEDQSLCWQPCVDKTWPNWQHVYFTVAQETDVITSLQGHWEKVDVHTAFIQKHIPTCVDSKELGGKYTSDHFSDKRKQNKCLPNFSWLKRGRKLKTLALARVEHLL